MNSVSNSSAGCRNTYRLDSANPAVRMWINQPSVQQPFHNLNGTNVLAMEDTPGTYRVYFLSGNVVSQQIPKICLSLGWLNNPAPDNAVLVHSIPAEQSP